MYAPPNITRTIRSRRMGWTGHVTSMVQVRNAYKILVGKPKEDITQKNQAQMEG
jgi:hypothetical protein